MLMNLLFRWSFRSNQKIWFELGSQDCLNFIKSFIISQQDNVTLCLCVTCHWKKQFKISHIKRLLPQSLNEVTGGISMYSSNYYIAEQYAEIHVMMWTMMIIIMANGGGWLWANSSQNETTFIIIICNSYLFYLRVRKVLRFLQREHGLKLSATSWFAVSVQSAINYEVFCDLILLWWS